jgi:ABC-2 type transport system ATP-binding protein
MSAPIIQVSQLTKHYEVHKREAGVLSALASVFHRRYEIRKAVEGLSFAIMQGERVGFLGPNGAGKTTTLKMLSGLLHPTSGEVEVAGHVPQRRQTAFLQQITLVMGQKQQLLWDLPPADTFQLNRAVYGVPPRQYEETLAELSRLLDIGEVMRAPTRQLSLGERMKCELAAALLHRPRVLFLDEPTIGLDVSMQETLRRFVREYNDRFGATVLLTSHYMDDVAALCPRVIVIDQGRLRYDGDLQALARSIRPDKRVTMRLSQEVADLRQELAQVGEVVSCEGAQAVLQLPQARLRDGVAHLLGRLPIIDLTVEDPPLEEVMRDLFAGTLSGAQAGAQAGALPGTRGAAAEEGA